MSFIYKIYPVDNPTIHYIGSTKDKLSVRLAEHKYRYKVWKNDYKRGKYSVFKLFDDYGFENCKIEELQKLEGEKYDILRKEGEWILKDRENCINRCVAGRTRKEWRRDRKLKLNSPSNDKDASDNTIQYNQ